MKGRYGDAADCLNRALSIREAVFGPTSPTVAEVLTTQAVLLRRTHRRSEAKDLEKRARLLLSAHANENRLGQQTDISTLLAGKK
jgi:hypothetical protein